jgi:hypothetical protein
VTRRRTPATETPLEDRPVDHAIATQPCTKCGAAIGVPCKVEVRGRFHDGAHGARLEALTDREVG